MLNMKFGFALIALMSLVPLGASAKTGRECLAELNAEAKDCPAGVGESILAKHHRVDSCKSVVDAAVPGTGLKSVNRDIYVLDRNAIVIKDNLVEKFYANTPASSAIPGTKCFLKYVQLPDTVKDFKVMEGRVFMTTKEGRLLVMNRLGMVVEFLNARGDSYSVVENGQVRGGISDIKVNTRRQSLELNFIQGGQTELSLETIYSRVNSRDKVELIGF